MNPKVLMFHPQKTTPSPTNKQKTPPKKKTKKENEKKKKTHSETSTYKLAICRNLQ